MVDFTVSSEDSEMIDHIADKASELFGYDRLGVEMDLKACHANGCKLDLQKLITADEFNMTHDLMGINRHINHNTGTLENCFLPRCAAN